MLKQNQPLRDCRPPSAVFSAESIFILCVMAVCTIVGVILITSIAIGIGLGVGLGNQLSAYRAYITYTTNTTSGST
jgi:hypothetical protein